MTKTTATKLIPPMATATFVIPDNPIAQAMAAKARLQAQNPTKGRKGKTPRPCACECGEMTRGGKWYPGHDSRFNSLVLRAERARLALESKAA